MIETLLLGHEMSPAELAAANRVLRYHGCAEVAGGTVAVLLDRILGMELGRASHIMRELTTALDAVEDEVKR